MKWQHLNQFIKFIDTENAVRVVSLPLVSGHLTVALIRFTSQLLKFSSVNTTIIESFAGKCQGGRLHHYTISEKMDIIFHINTTWQAPQ